MLQAIRLHGALPGAEIARLTRLTAQTISLITKRLLDDGLLLRGAPLRGKVGQPSVPLALNPDGAFSIGIKVGRRSLDVLLVDFTGAGARSAAAWTTTTRPRRACSARSTLRMRRVPRASSAPAGRERAAGHRHRRAAVAGRLAGTAGRRARASPRLEPHRPARAGRRAAPGCRSSFVKDTAAACVAELVAGRGRSVRSFLYVFVDTFIGGGLVIDSHLRGGLQRQCRRDRFAGRSAAQRAGDTDAPAQLLSVASLLNLEQRFDARRARPAPRSPTRGRCKRPGARSHTAWLGRGGARDRARDPQRGLPARPGGRDRRRLVQPRAAGRAAGARSTPRCDRYNWEGVQCPQLLPGTIGSDARALGGALLPLHANFAPDRDLFLKLGN